MGRSEGQQKGTHILHPFCLTVSLELCRSSATRFQLTLMSVIDGLLLLFVNDTVVHGMAK